MTTKLETLQTLEAAHANLVQAKYAALGLQVGCYSRALEIDPEILASYNAVKTAQRAYSKTCK